MSALGPFAKYKHFHAPEFTDERLALLAKELLEERMYLSDEYRNEKAVNEVMYRYFSGDPKQGLHIPVMIGDFQGMLTFRDIIPGFKCSLLWQLWDKGVFTKELVREATALLDQIMDDFKLVRIEGNTTLPEVKRLAEMIGLEYEGLAKKSFRWDGKLYDTYLLGRVRGGDDV